MAWIPTNPINSTHSAKLESSRMSTADVITIKPQNTIPHAAQAWIFLALTCPNPAKAFKAPYSAHRITAIHKKIWFMVSPENKTPIHKWDGRRFPRYHPN